MKLPTTDAEHIEFWHIAGNRIVSRINAAPKRDVVVEAIQALMERIVQSGNSLNRLYEANTHDWKWDGAAILRVVYDAMIQGLYILHSDCDNRSRRFLDFYWIEHERGMRVIDAGETDMAKQLAASPKRAAVEPIFKSEFDRVCKLYSINPAKTLPANWYSRDEKLWFQAGIAGYKTEYDFIFPQLCGAVHSSYYVLRPNGGKFPLSLFHLVHFGQLFAYRLLAALADYVGVTFDEVEAYMVKIARKNVCNH
jgi:hypothetical protein